MAPNIPRNRFKAAFSSGRKQIGFWLTLASPAAAEIAAEAGYDWLLIDMEHAANEVGDVAHQVRATQRGTAEPMVRVPELNAAIVKRLLDAGVRSFMFPNIQDVEQAARAVAATRYPPRGVRGVAGTTRGAGYGRWPTYFAEAENEICVVLQLETAAAVAAASEIGAVDGVDALFIGPADLAADMGYIGKPGTPEVQAVIAQGLATIKSTGKPAGTLNFTMDAALRQFGEGFDFIAVGGDGSMLSRQTTEMVNKFTAALNPA
jgi:4-hydroxy-2-oxoheptanedioate aldolase